MKNLKLTKEEDLNIENFENRDHLRDGLKLVNVIEKLLFENQK